MLNSVRTFPRDEEEQAKAHYGANAVLARTPNHLKLWVCWETITAGKLVNFCKFQYAGVEHYVVMNYTALGYAFCMLKDGKLCANTLHIGTAKDVMKDYEQTLRVYVSAPEFAPISADVTTAEFIKKHA